MPSKTPDVSGARRVLRGRVIAVATALLLGAAGAVASNPPPAPERVALAGHTLAALAGAAPAAAVDEPMTLTIVLRRDDEAGFQQFLHDVYDPQSSGFHKFLDARQLAERFGPSQAAYDSVASYFTTHGFARVEDSANRLTLTLNAARNDVQDALGVRIGDYASGARTFHANDREPSLPADVAAHVHSIAGLSNLGIPQPLNQSAPPPEYYQCPAGVDPARCDIYGPLCAIYSGSRATGEFLQTLEGAGKGVKDYVKSYNAYNKNVQDYYAACLENQFPSDASSVASSSPPVERPGGGVPWREVDGSGQTVGLVEFDQYNTSDIVNYLDMIGAAPAQIGQLSEVSIGAGASFGAAESEVILDIDTVMGLAPGANVVVYSASFQGAGASFQRVFNRMVDDGVDVISNSWAYCEDQTTQADVDGIDSILQTAAAAGISVFSGSGDTGSTCLDGAANTVAVPADVPHLTAVGGTSLQAGAGGVWRGETWWDGSADTPQTGQGGFGSSRFFARPAYQDGFTASNARSLPDVALVADPATGMMICQIDAGGCPTGLLYGGTSMAAPIWAAYAALVNHARGTPLGAANQGLYPLAATSAFHSAASMGSDFAHVGLGSPNLAALNLLLDGNVPGTPDAATSEVLATAPPVAPFGDNDGVPADGATPGVVLVTLRDADGNTVAGKTVALTANAGTHATVTPASIATGDDGVALFKVTDLTVEELTFTASDASDGVVVGVHPRLPFIAPFASAGGIAAFPTAQEADGVSFSTVTVTLHDGLGRPSPGKRVLLHQDGHALILGANPATSAADGTAEFEVSDQATELVAFTAIDLGDGDLAVPGSADVNFDNGVGCGATGAPIAAPGYAISLYASGFPTQNGVNFGGIAIGGCVGIGGFAFDAAGNLYASDYVSGDVYRLPPGGGVASVSNRITATPIGPSLGALAFGTDGRLYGARVATTGDFTTGAVLHIDTTNGTATQVGAPLTCPFSLSTDPLSGDLFVSDGCFGGGADDASIWRIADPAGASPTTSIYASTNASPNGGLGFAPDGTLYVVYAYNGFPGIDVITGTDQAQPAVVMQTGIASTFAVTPLGTAAGGGAQALLVGASRYGGFPQSVATFDLTLDPPVFSGVTVEETGAGAPRTVGPDGCLYLNTGVGIYRLGNADGSCPLLAQLAPNPSLVVAPNDEPPIAAQGSLLRFGITFPHTVVPVGTPITVVVQGANAVQQVVYIGFNPDASFAYTGAHVGTDSLVAYATVDGAIVVSNEISVQWTAGVHSTSLDLNASTTSGSTGSNARAQSTLLDRSSAPPVPIADASITFALAGATCVAVTDANGVAACELALGNPATAILTATYAGDAGHLPATASIAFQIVSDRIFADGFESL